jgi:hypothetical protein
MVINGYKLCESACFNSLLEDCKLANGEVLFWALETFAVLDLQFSWSLQRWK